MRSPEVIVHIMNIDHTAFFNGYRESYGRLTPSVIAGLELLGRNMETDSELENLQWAAYMLATVKHECADTWQPIVERGPKSYFDKYETGTPLGRRLGNSEPGDGWRFRGRGYVQITGRANYSRMTKELGLGPDADLEQDPEQTLRPAIAYQIMSVGMRKGLFTGKKLSDYISEGGCDYRNARRIINGVDQAALIAQYAGTIEGILRVSIINS
jgi:putative chitinase